MGWFVGISTRTPTTSICLTAAPSSHAPDALPHFWTLLKGTPFVKVHPLSGRSRRAPTASRPGTGRRAAARRAAASRTDPPESAGAWIGKAVPREPGLGQGGLDQRAVQPQRQRRDFPRRPARLLPGPGVTLPQRRRDHLLDERDLALGRCPDGTQVPRFHAVPAQRGRGAGDLERIRAVYPPDPADQPERLQLGQLLVVDPGRGEQLAPAQRAAPRGARRTGR